MSIKPKLVCPPDYSILSLRFTECKKLGVVKGTQTLLQSDLSSFYIPLTNYSEKRFTLRAGKTQKLDIGDIASYWELNEAYKFIYNNEGVSDLTSHAFTVFDETGVNALGTFVFTVNVTNLGYQNFAEGFATALQATTSLNDLITATFGPAASEFTITAKTKGKRYRYLMEYDTSGFGGTNPPPYLHPGTLLTKDYKYPEGRVRAIYLYADYSKADTTKCGSCVDASGDLLSNVKNFKWAYDSDYTSKQTSAGDTGVIVNSNAFPTAGQLNQDGTQTFQWLTDGSPAAYALSVGDLITLNTTTDNPYGFVTEIDGYNITVDRQGFGTGLLTDEIVKKYAPAAINWKSGGEMLFLSGGQDVYDTDRLYTETVWLHNPQSFDIPFTAIIVS